MFRCLFEHTGPFLAMVWCFRFVAVFVSLLTVFHFPPHPLPPPLPPPHYTTTGHRSRPPHPPRPPPRREGSRPPARCHGHPLHHLPLHPCLRPCHRHGQRRSAEPSSHVRPTGPGRIGRDIKTGVGGVHQTLRRSDRAGRVRHVVFLLVLFLLVCDRFCLCLCLCDGCGRDGQGQQDPSPSQS